MNDTGKSLRQGYRDLTSGGAVDHVTKDTEKSLRKGWQDLSSGEAVDHAMHSCWRVCF